MAAERATFEEAVDRKTIAEGLHEQVGQELTTVVIGLRPAEAGETLEHTRLHIAAVHT